MVAATFDRARFSCAECEEAEARGRDLRSSNSGAAKSCQGPRRWEFFKRHASRGFTWTGCPRTALSHREAAWIGLYDRCEGKLTLTEAERSPMLTLEAFDALDTVRALQSWERIENARAESNRPTRGR